MVTSTFATSADKHVRWQRLNELVWWRRRLIGLDLVVEEDLTCRYCRSNKHKVFNSSLQNKTEISKKGNKMLPLLTSLLCNLLWICQWTQKERLQCVLVWGRREWRREGGKDSQACLPPSESEEWDRQQMRLRRGQSDPVGGRQDSLWCSCKDNMEFPLALWHLISEICTLSALNCFSIP